MKSRNRKLQLILVTMLGAYGLFGQPTAARAAAPENDCTFCLSGDDTCADAAQICEENSCNSSGPFCTDDGFDCTGHTELICNAIRP